MSILTLLTFEKEITLIVLYKVKDSDNIMVQYYKYTWCILLRGVVMVLIAGYIVVVGYTTTYAVNAYHH